MKQFSTITIHTGYLISKLMSVISGHLLGLSLSAPPSPKRREEGVT